MLMAAEPLPAWEPRQVPAWEPGQVPLAVVLAVVQRRERWAS